MNWYDSVDWYSSDNGFPAGGQGPGANRPPKKPASKLPGNKKARIIALIICGALVAAAGIWLLVDLIMGNFNLYDDGGDGMPKSYVTYLDSLYSSSQSSFTTNIPRVKELGDFGMKFSKNSGSELSFNEIYAKCAPAVVGIKVYYPDDGDFYGWGSGMIASEDGYILTNGHIVDKGEKAVILLYNGTSAEAKLVALDSENDLAILKIDRHDLPYVSFASSAELSVGDSVCAIGNPLGPNYSLSMTGGIVSGTERSVTLDGLVMDLVQTDAVINNGNSGGPLINSYGNVVGITNMKFVSTFDNSIEGMSFAVPSDSVKEFVDSVMGNFDGPGEPTIGIVVGAVTEKVAEYYNVPDGLYVSSVREGTDAAKYLQKADIITKVNGKEVHKVSDMSEIKAKLKIGDTISFTVWRNGEQLKCDVKLVDSHSINRSK